MKKNSKKAVWKDTETLPFSIHYSYPLEIRNRCLFFWATTIKGWKAIINLADRLTESNRACVVYLFGSAKEEIINRHIEKINNQKVIVLWACYIDPEQIECVMNGAETIKLTVKKMGITNIKYADLDRKNPYEGNAIEDDFYTKSRML